MYLVICFATAIFGFLIGYLMASAITESKDWTPNEFSPYADKIIENFKGSFLDNILDDQSIPIEDRVCMLNIRNRIFSYAFFGLQLLNGRTIAQISSNKTKSALDRLREVCNLIGVELDDVTYEKDGENLYNIKLKEYPTDYWS